jgi:hypothetical protein
MTRQWISIRGPWGIRIDQSREEDFGSPNLVARQRYEITQTLIDAAVKKGGPMSRERANYIVNKTLAVATFDERSGITFRLRGNRDAVISQMCEVMSLWDFPMTAEEATRIVDRAIAARSWFSRRFWWIIAGTRLVRFAHARSRHAREHRLKPLAIPIAKLGRSRLRRSRERRLSRSL